MLAKIKKVKKFEYKNIRLDAVFMCVTKAFHYHCLRARTVNIDQTPLGISDKHEIVFVNIKQTQILSAAT